MLHFTFELRVALRKYKQEKLGSWSCVGENGNRARGACFKTCCASDVILTKSNSSATLSRRLFMGQLLFLALGRDAISQFRPHDRLFSFLAFFSRSMMKDSCIERANRNQHTHVTLRVIFKKDYEFQSFSRLFFFSWTEFGSWSIFFWSAEITKRLGIPMLISTHLQFLTTSTWHRQYADHPWRAVSFRPADPWSTHEYSKCCRPRESFWFLFCNYFRFHWINEKIFLLFKIKALKIFSLVFFTSSLDRVCKQIINEKKNSSPMIQMKIQFFNGEENCQAWKNSHRTTKSWSRAKFNFFRSTHRNRVLTSTRFSINWNVKKCGSERNHAN